MMMAVQRLNVLVACETSGAVREAFRGLGHEAWSCDLLPSDFRTPYHYQADCITAIMWGGWDVVIAHPPCTHLAASGARHFAAKRADGRQQQGIDLFLGVVKACDKIGARWAVENPIGIMSRLYRKPDQIIQPWQFGHGETKATCLWLSGLPRLTPTNVVAGREAKCHRMPPSPDRWKLRSKTYDGIAHAMAAQWGGAISGEAASKPINRPMHSQATMEWPAPLPVATTDTERIRRENTFRASQFMPPVRP